MAPHASPRVYCIPKPGTDIVSLPLAIVRAVADGANVCFARPTWKVPRARCSTTRWNLRVVSGRRGRGTAIVFPVGRETSSPPDSVHASLSLSLRDPRAILVCFASRPAGKKGAGFSGAIARGVCARSKSGSGLSVARSRRRPDVSVHFRGSLGALGIEWCFGHCCWRHVARPGRKSRPAVVGARGSLDENRHAGPPGAAPHAEQLADVSDVRPAARDPDCHNVKHGYGRLHAARACFTAADPVAAALIVIGEEGAAATYCDLRVIEQI